MFYDFDVNMKQGLLFKIIRMCESVGCRIGGIVCDMGNKTLLSQLKVKNLCSFFANPADSSRFVYIFPDMPHCVKNLRNHMLDHGLVVKLADNKNVRLTKQHFLDLLSCQTGDMTLCHKVNLTHLEVRGMDRQRVRPAMQLFSFSVAMAFIQV